MATTTKNPTVSAVPKPPEMSSSPVDRVVGALVVEWRGRGRYPPGPGGNTFARTLKIARDPLPILLGAYEDYGPIFTLRLLHTRVVFMLGPEANHYVTVSHPENFHWRESSFGDLIPLLGDGLLTIDEDYHDRARAIMMPAFHREQIVAATEAMTVEADEAIATLPVGEVVDVYEWMRNLAMRIAMRALLGLDPDEAGKGAVAAEHFERALGFYGIDFALRLLRGPGSPWRKMNASRAVLDEIVFGEIARRRADPDCERKAALPRGAYVPFGGGSRICIGKRFGQTEVKMVATMLLQRLRLDALPGRTMTIRQMPTLSPKGGLGMRVLPRA
jgi:cytochrome P450